jgi:hypothetical protein
MPENDRPHRQQRSQRLEERYGKIGISAVHAATQYSGRSATMRCSSTHTGSTYLPRKKLKKPQKTDR